jgi:hypothetical protein
MNYIKEQLLEIKNSISETAEECDRKPGEIKLIAVSKTFPPEAIQAAYEAGQRIFGENRVQEMSEKDIALPEDIEWHLIGHLQSNKIKKALGHADCVHSIDKLKLLEKINRQAEILPRKPEILLEINISGEESKFGIREEKGIMSLASKAAEAENLEFKGLMTMAPFGAGEKELRNVFGGLRALRDKIESELGIELPELSMGMSADYKTAIKEGATMVRIGTAIFGKRNYGQ